jgi:signal transduction histidine kinase/CheY-like chemotaxis protein
VKAQGENVSFYILSPLFALFIHLFLAFLVLKADHRSFLHRVFALTLLGMGLWGLAIYGMRSSPDLETALVRDKAIVAIGPVTAVLFYHFSLIFTGTSSRRWLVVGYSLSAVFVFLAPTNLVFSSMRQGIYGYAPTWGYMGAPFMLMVYGAMALAISNLVKFWRSSTSKDQRYRAALIIAGITCVPLGGVTDALHMIEIPVPPLGIIGNILFGCLATIAILKYRLLDIHVVIRKGIAYTLLSGLVVAIYVLLVLLASNVIHWQQISMAFTVVTILVITIALQPVLHRLQQAVDKWFYRDRYNQLKALEEFSQQNHDVTNLDTLSSSLVSLVKVALRSVNVSLLMPRGSEKNFTVVASTSLASTIPNVSIKRNGPVIRWLKAHNGFISRKDIDVVPKLQALSAKEKDALDQLGMELLVSLKTRDDLAGILALASKVSGETYSKDDKRVLTVVSRQISAALDNARLYKEVQEALRELQKTQNQLLRTERLRAVGEVAAGVGHDLRNLLAVTLGRAQLALEKVKYNGKLKSDLRIIEQAALDGAEVVNRLQSFTKIGSDLSFELVDMNRILLDALQMIEPRLSQQREIEDVTTDVIVNLGEVQSVKGKPSELREMLTNILVNAIESMPAGGKLTLTSRQENNSVVISIDDTGVGIASKVRKRIFEPFYTTKGPQGVGLGLSIAYSVAKKHGGDIVVSSEVGKGSTFTIRLPITKRKRVRQAVSGKVLYATKKGAKALIIDDDKAVREVLSEILESDGYSVDLASSGKRGLALTRQKDYAVLITDLGMPGMSGRDLAKAVNTLKPTIPIFLITGWDVQLQPAELIEWGVTGVITKPFTKTNVLAQIKRY